MFKYIIKRILIFIPTIIAISLITFIISLNAPGDPVAQKLQAGTAEGQAADRLATEQAYNELRAKLGLDLPIFYFGFSNLAESDTLHRIAKKEHRKTLKRLTYKYGNWEMVSGYYHSLRNFELEVLDTPRDSLNANALISIRENLLNIFNSYKDDVVRMRFQNISSLIDEVSTLSHLDNSFAGVSIAYDNMLQNPAGWKTYVPVVHLYGFHNQYHRWFTRFIQGDFGISYQDDKNVSAKIWDALPWTMLISFISILITYIVSIPIGVFSAVRKGSLADQVITTILFILYSMPSFWVATLLIIYLGGGDYLAIFPPYGVGEVYPDDSFFQVIGTRAYYLTLPLICWTYGSFAFLSRQMRGGMLTVLNQDYIRTAKAKGLEDKKVIWKHSFRNSLLPIITLFAYVFPAMIGGSIVLEVIFSIPGMGKLGYEAIIFRDYPVVFTVMMFSAILTLVGYLVADILYTVVDPRISFTKKM